MGEKIPVIDLELGSGIDISELKKGLSEAEQEYIKYASKVFETIEKNAQEQTEIIRKEEAEKIAIIKKSMEEQIEAVKANKGLSGADKQKEIQAIKDAENAKIKAVKEGAKLQEATVKSMAAAQTKTIQEQAKKQLKAIRDGYKGSGQAIKDFAKGAAGALVGLDQVLASLAGGPAAIGKLVVDMGKKAVAALNEMAEAWRQQEKVEVALANAAKNNPYLSPRNVTQLKAFANEMQRTTGIDSVQIMQTETRLASLGRNQQQMQKIIKTASDMAAAGVMDFDSAVFELNNSYNGLIRTSGRLYPELKKLSKEAFASGEAIDIIAGKVAGSAAEAMRTGAGSVTAYNNALSSLKKFVGEGWEEATRPARIWITGLLNDVNETLSKRKALKDAEAKLKPGAGNEEEIKKLEEYYKTLGDRLKQYEKDIKKVSEAEKTEYQNSIDRVKALMGETTAEIHKLKTQTSNDIDDILSAAEAKAEVTADIATSKFAALTKDLPTVLKNYLGVVAFGLPGIVKAGVDVFATQKAATVEMIKDQEKTIALLGKAAEETKANQKDYSEAVERLRKQEQDALNEIIKGIEEKARAEGMFEKEIEENVTIRLAKAAALAGFEQKLLDMAKQEVQAKDEQLKKDGERAVEAQKLIAENQKALDAEIEKIIRKAKLEGKDIDSMEVKKQILDAETNAYENLLTAAKDYLTEIEPDQRRMLARLKTEWELHRKIAEQKQWDDEQEKKRLSELTSRNNELDNQLKKILDDVKGDAKRQTELAREKDYQEQVEKLKGISAEKAAEFEKRVARSKATELAEQRKKELQENLTEQEQALTKLQQAEMDKYREGHPARTAIENEFNEKKKKLAEDTADTIVQIEANLNTEIRNINAATYDYLEQREDALLQKRLQSIREFLSASQQIAGNISTTWTNIVDYQTEEKRKANSEMVQSDEDRARREKEIEIEALNRRYKADLFTWSANTTLATATAALAALEAYRKGTEQGGVAVGAIQMAIAIATGAMQIAAVASAMPKPPRFHSGGVVQGRAGQEVSAVLKAQEVVNTPQQFSNTMQAIANLAQMKGGGATVVQPQVKINNTISDQANVSVRYNPEGLVVDIVNKALGEGRLNQGLAMQNLNAQGATYL
jgi:hypothetical protein